ncbi:hypothetical protein [Kitasatospora sp. NPDC006786]|uniref:hypothetical protein n=1 Tax=unclassified Kitasatospora TaxID=2633591 RepID=UPI0033EA1D85
MIQNYFGMTGVPLTPENLYRQGMKLAVRDWGEAERLLTAAAEAGYRPAIEHLSSVELGGGRWTELLADMGDPDGLYRAGRVRAWHASQSGSYGREKALRDEAIEYFEKALEAGREDAVVCLGDLIYKSGRLEEAIPALERAIEYLERNQERDENLLGWKLERARKEIARQQKKAEKRAQGDVRSRWWRGRKRG